MHPLFAVIPAQAGIQRLLRGARLDPGSALRAVLDDTMKSDAPPFAVIPAQAGIQWLLRGARLDPGSALRAVRDDVPARRYAPSGMTP